MGTDSSDRELAVAQPQSPGAGDERSAHEAIAAKLGLLLGWLAPLLLLLALIGAAAGQYFLSVQNDLTMATIGYALGVAAFASALIAERFLPQARRWSLGLADERKRGAPTLVASLAGVLLLASLASVNAPDRARLSAVAWALGLLLALAAALPPRQLSLGASIVAGLVWLKTVLWTREAAAVALIAAVGAALRFYDLPNFPSGIHGDETGFGLIALSILKGEGPNPFGTAFLDDPALFFYLEAPFIAVFGQTITALRLFAAVSGTLTLPVFYLFVRRLFGMRPALLALLLLAGSAVHVHFSRIALNVPQVPVLSCLTLWALWEGQRSRRAFWWLAAGISGGLAVYFHFAGRFVPLVIGFYLVFLLVTQRRFWRDWLWGAGFALLGGLITLAPMGVHLASQWQRFTGHMTGRLIFENWDRMSAAYHTESTAVVLWEQLKTNLLAFVSGMNGSSFYPIPGAAMLTPMLGPLFAFGLVLMVLRFGDGRFAMLAFSFWTVVILNGALTIDSPQPHRLLPALLPALAGAALVLDWLVAMGQRLAGPTLGLPFLVAAFLVPVVAGYADDASYFGPAARLKPWEPVNVQARYVAALGPAYRVYTLGTPLIYFDHSITRFLAPDVTGDSLHNPSASLPLALTPDHDLAFLVYPHMEGYLPMLRSFYPAAETEVVSGRSGTVFTALLVPRAELARYQGLTAHYSDSERVELDAALLGGGALSYPASASWSGSLYAGQIGRYLIQAEGVPAEVLIDGVSLGSRGERELAIGWHALEIKARLPTSESRLALQWQPPGQALASVPGQLLDTRPLAGNLRCRLESEDGTFREWREPAVGLRGVADLFALRQPSRIVWEGTLRVARSGRYTLRLNAIGEAEILIDGRSVVANPGGSVELRSGSATLDLDEGAHPITVRYAWRQPPGMIEVLWTPPGEQMSVIPPDAFGPPQR